jgi:hypothetical protein
MLERGAQSQCQNGVGNSQPTTSRLRPMSLSVAAQIEPIDRVAQRPCHDMLRPAGIEQRDLVTPIGEPGQLQRTGGLAFGDAADFATESVKGVDRFSARRRQQPQRPEEWFAGDVNPGRDLRFFGGARRREGAAPANQGRTFIDPFEREHGRSS